MLPVRGSVHLIQLHPSHEEQLTQLHLSSAKITQPRPLFGEWTGPQYTAPDAFNDIVLEVHCVLPAVNDAPPGTAQY